MIDRIKGFFSRSINSTPFKRPLTSLALNEMFNFTRPVCDFPVATFTYPAYIVCEFLKNAKQRSHRKGQHGGKFADIVTFFPKTRSLLRSRLFDVTKRFAQRIMPSLGRALRDIQRTAAKETRKPCENVDATGSVTELFKSIEITTLKCEK